MVSPQDTSAISRHVFASERQTFKKSVILCIDGGNVSVYNKHVAWAQTNTYGRKTVARIVM
jgi:hypothetical protein